MSRNTPPLAVNRHGQEEVRRRLAAVLRERLEHRWQEVIGEPLCEQITGNATLASRRALWLQLADHLTAWCERKAVELSTRMADSDSADPVVAPCRERLLDDAERSLEEALAQMALALAVIRDGNRAAEDELLQQLTPRLEYLAWRFEPRGRMRGLTKDDLFCEACLKFRRSICRFRPEHPRRPMVSTFVLNMVLNHLRDATQERQTDKFSRGRGGMEEVGDEDLRGAHRQSALERHRVDEEELDARETRQAIDQICSQLVEQSVCRPEKVMAFRLWFFHNEGFAGIGRTVRQRTGVGSTGWAHGAVRLVARLVYERLKECTQPA